MAIVELYSKSQKKLRGEIPDIYSYDNIPKVLRVQIVHIIQDTLRYYVNREEVYQWIHRTLCREYGVFTLGKVVGESDSACILNHLLWTKEIDCAIDVIQLAFGYFYENLEWWQYIPVRRSQSYISPEQSISDLNCRFKEHMVGFQFEAGKIIRVDSTYTHSEITKPTLELLWNPKFSGANEEYLKAHEHYRHGRNKECLNECLKSFESTLKIICSEKGWSYSPNDTSKKLIQTCFGNGLIPTFTQNQFTSLQSLIESGIPTIRNKLGGHGQGQTPQEVDDGMTRYALNLTGSNIIFLIEQSGIK